VIGSVGIVLESLSPAQARRVLLAAQGFGRPQAAVGTRQLNLLLDRLGVLQLDSVNVFERSHYLPAFARLGTYNKTDLDRLTFGQRSNYVEYWAHEAALIPLADWPLWRWKMTALRTTDPVKHEWARSNTEMLDWLRTELSHRGPVAASEIEHDAGKGAGGWWGWSEVKHGLEFLFRWGEVVSAGRTRFERTYALAEAAMPTDVLQAEISRADAHRVLVERAARALGVGTASDLADYFRLRSDDTIAAIRELEDAGVLVPVTVPGWRSAWLHRDATVPRRIETQALLSPFDPVVWDRKRADRMFGFFYRIEIYTPAPKRQYGYYTLPLLQDDAIVGRVDLKSDRQNRVLRVQSAWHEPGQTPDLERLAQLLRQTAAWQGLESIVVQEWGDLARELSAALGVEPVERVIAARPAE